MNSFQSALLQSSRFCVLHRQKIQKTQCVIDYDVGSKWEFATDPPGHHQPLCACQSRNQAAGAPAGRYVYEAHKAAALEAGSRLTDLARLAVAIPTAKIMRSSSAPMSRLPAAGRTSFALYCAADYRPNGKLAITPAGRRSARARQCHARPASRSCRRRRARDRGRSRCAKAPPCRDGSPSPCGSSRQWPA